MSGDDKLRIARLELAVETMASWLVQAQTGFGERDAKGIHKILDGGSDDYLILGGESPTSSQDRTPDESDPAREPEA